MSSRASVARILIAITAACLAAATTSCSSSKAKAPSTPAASTTPSASTPAAETSSGGSSADIATITSTYIAFFSTKTPLAKSMSLIQDGAEFKTTLIAQENSAFAKEASVTVSKVVVNSAAKATVTFSILINGSPTLSNQAGYAVYEGGAWKVAGSTFCGLLIAQGTPPPVCSKAAATSVPN